MKQFMLFVAIILMAFIGCDDNLPYQPYIPTITLTAEEVAVTDVYLRLKVVDCQKPVAITLKRDSQIIFSQHRISLDTILYEEQLLPNRVYRYTAIKTTTYWMQESTYVDIRTMDTTSHNFTWQIDTLGDGGNSMLRDVAIIDENNIWAVGEIYKNGETDAYNAAYWNGSRWTLKRIPTQMYGGYIGYFPIMTVYGFSTSDIWMFSDAGSYSHWDGTVWNTKYVAEHAGTGIKLWGTNSSNIYLVGTNGSISHYNGSSWQKMESGTDVDLIDVYGSPDGSIVWACGYYHSKRGTYLLRYTGESGWELAYDGSAAETIIRSDSLSGAYSTLFTPVTKRLYVASDAGMYAVPSSTRGEGNRLSFTSGYFPGFPNRLRGNNINDLIIVGDFNLMAHFNGINWRYFSEFHQQDQHLLSVDQKGNFVVAVGEVYDPIHSKGLVYRGRR
jgi:hypothetical protein